MDDPLPQSPDELFDVLTPDGEHTGVTKRRADVHHDGDWHAAVHVWVWGIDYDDDDRPLPYLLLNQRGAGKDTWPLALDATVGGHLGAGETVEDAFREINEEIGIQPDLSTLVRLFTRKRSSGDLIPGMLDQEFQEVYLLRDDRSLRDFRPNPVELEGLVKLMLTDALPLFRGETSECDGIVLEAQSTNIYPIHVTPESLLVRGADRYFVDVAEAVAELAARAPSVNQRH